MTGFDLHVLAERTASVERHLARVEALANRLARAAGFRNVVAHAYETIDMKIVYDAARQGPADLRAFLARVRDIARSAPPA